MIQGGEIIIIAVLALVVLGPDRLPAIARKMGKWSMELRNAARDMTTGLQAEVDEVRQAGQEVRQAGQELRAPMDEVKKPFTEIRDEMSGFGRGGHEWKGPKPVSGPTPEDAMRDLEEMNRAAEASPDDAASEYGPLSGSDGTPPSGPSSLEGDKGDTSPDRPAASPPSSPDGDTSGDASSEEGDGDTDEPRE